MLPALVLVAAVAAADAREATDPFPGAHAASYLVALDDTVLWSRAADAPRAPASLTKLMTALVVLEGAWDPEARVRVGSAAAASTGSKMGLREGDVLIARDALQAMLVASANDACAALAEQAAGTQAAFVARMNARAAALGLTTTRFADPCGHDAAGQHTSARDLLTITREALAHAEVASAVATTSATVRTQRGRSFALANGNLLLTSLPGARGVKTGYTAAAGKCVIALAERDGRRVIAIVLDASERWLTATGLVEKAFHAPPKQP